MTEILASIVLLLLLLATGCRLWLLRRQSERVRAERHRVPEAFVESVPLDAHQKASDYTAARARLAIVESLFDAALFVVVTWGGGLAFLDAWWRSLGFAGIALGITVAASLFLLVALAGWPLSLYRVFGIEARFGFNRTTWKTYAADLVKGLILAALLGVPLLAAVLALMHAAGELWWLYAWLVWGGFSLALAWAYPALIAPLFNRFQPISDAELARRIEALIERCGFASRGVFVMDGSRRSAHGNAYFTGLGVHKRIVLFDTLIERLNAAEVEAVLAHELGHFRLHHVRKRLLVNLTAGLAALYALGQLVQWPPFYEALGGVTPSPHAALILFAFLLPVLAFWLAPLASAWSRRHEFEADEFARRHSDARELAAALVKLYRDNATTLTPDALYSAFFDSHPPAPVRIARLRTT
jgi:STE24 endopeptidase